MCPGYSSQLQKPNDRYGSMLFSHEVKGAWHALVIRHSY